MSRIHCISTIVLLASISPLVAQTKSYRLPSVDIK